MSLEAIAVLKKGLENLKKNVKQRKDNLDAQLAKQIPISSSEQHWLDNDANVVDEQLVINYLEVSSDYERALETLDESGKGVVMKLRELARELTEKPGNKRKRPERKPKEMASNPAPTPVSTKRENATLQQRIEILDWHHEHGGNQTATAKHFSLIYPGLAVKQPLISSWLKDEVKWRTLMTKSQGENDRIAKRVRQTQHPEVDEMVELWVSKAMDDGVLLTGEVVRQKWTVFADLAGIPDDERPTLSNGWLERFKIRNGLKQVKRRGAVGPADSETLARERMRIQEVVAGYALCDIFYMEKTCLSYGIPPDRGLAESGVKVKKAQLTYALTTNADGSEKLRPFVIGNTNMPRAFRKKTGAQLGFYYRSNAKAWMTASLYQEWLNDWDRELARNQRKILLLQNNFSGQIVTDRLQNIRVENLEPNLIGHVQLLDQGIIRCFKAHYRTKFIERSILRHDGGSTSPDIYEINQLQAMRLADAAWREVDTRNIWSCWHSAGILLPPAIGASSSAQASFPQHGPPDPATHAEKQVEAALDCLVALGALHTNNRLDIEELLNTEGESQDLSDQEIYQAVMDTAESRENEGDDVDNNASTEDPPSYQDVLKAVSVINNYIGYMDDPIARDLEAVFSSFTRQLRADKSRSIKMMDCS